MNQQRRLLIIVVVTIVIVVAGVVWLVAGRETRYDTCRERVSATPLPSGQIYTDPPCDGLRGPLDF